jgi:tetratricopeptide (TPR) repeat protein
MRILLSILLVSFTAGPCFCQSYFQTRLDPGPYKVGFRTGVHFDIGRPAIREQYAAYRQGRAVHISVWYPARPKNNHPKMMYAEYVDEVSRMINPQDVTKKTRTKSTQQMCLLLSQLGGDSLILKKHLPALLAENVNAYKNAPYLGGTYPILMYPESPNLNNILSEYLASYGYIVVSMSRHGTLDADFEWQTVRGIETLVQDCQFALAVVKKEFKIKNDAVATLGTGMNASAGLAWMMRDPSIDAMVSLEGGILTSYEYGLIQKSPYFDIYRADRPILAMHSPHESVNPRLIDHYKYADRYMISLPKMSEFYYLNFGIWEKTMPGILGSAPGDTKLGYEWMARYTMFFLDWKIKQGYHGKTFFENKPEAQGIPPGLLEYTFIPHLDVPPTSKALLLLNQAEGFSRMLEEVKKYQRQDSSAFSFETYVAIGQQLMAEKKFENGIEWAANFQQLFPSAASAYTIAGRCYLELGNRTDAIAMYSNALKLLPSDSYLQPSDKEPLKGAIENRLKQLSQ